MRTMTNRLTKMLALTGLCFWFGAADAGAQTAYTYTVIADVTNCYNIGSPALNNNGEVAFGATCGEPVGPASGAIVIRRGNGGPLTPIYAWDGVGQHVPQTDVLSINDAGVIAFAVSGLCPNAGAAAIWTGDGTSIDTVHDICAQPGFTSVLRPSISNTGAVAFMAASGNSYDFVIRARAGTSTTIAGPGTSPAGIGPLSMAYEPSINNNDVVTFMGNRADTGAGILFTGTGGPLTTISLDSLGSFNGINDLGRVAFLASPGAIQTGDGGPVTTIATVGPYLSFPGAGASINSAGKVAFTAFLPSGVLGVFTGPDPATDAVLKSGDVIPEFGTVAWVGILREAINDRGQVAMTVQFEGGAIAIIRADPPNTSPVASDVSASVAAGGSVSGTLSASDSDGEPITYSLVANGTKGVAVIDNVSTGAYTYTANAGTDGDDTFTFQVTDSRGLTSNVATVTVNIQGGCATNVTSSVSVSPGSLRLDRKSGRYSQKVTLRNMSGAAIPGPLSFVLDSLTPGATLVNRAGVTACSTPSGSPYVNVDVGSDSVFTARERTNGSLEFTLEFVSPGAVSYTARVLAGSGSR